MNGQLVRVQTSDSVYLHGLVRPAASPRLLSIDAAIYLHGLGGNFYSSRLDQVVTTRVQNLGVVVAQINTRGHDSVNQTTRNGQTVNLGAAYEIVDDCRWDIEAWCDYLFKQGHQKIILMGHSLGAIKSIYAQALQPHAAVAGIVAVSASRLCYQKFLQMPTRDRFLYWINRASEQIAAACGEDLMEVDFPFPTLISASAYRDKYGPEDRYNWLKYARQITVPTLLTFGSRELTEHSAFVDIIKDLEGLKLSDDTFEIQQVLGANHFYATKQRALADVIANWLLRRFSRT